MAKDSEMIARDFVEAINQHDMERIDELMTDDHVFIDSRGASVRGRGPMMERRRKVGSGESLGNAGGLASRDRA